MWMTLEHPTGDYVGAAQHLCERMGHVARFQHMVRSIYIEVASQEARQGGTVNRYRDIECLGGLPERLEPGIAEQGVFTHRASYLHSDHAKINP